MKKHILKTLTFSLVLLFTAYQSQAQDMFTKGTTIAQAGLGVGYYTYTGYGFSPTVGITVDHCFFENVGPGSLGIGGYVGFNRASSSTFSDYNYTNIFFGARGTWYPKFAELLDGKFHAYAGANVGVWLETYKYGTFTDHFSHALYGPFVGCRYYFTKGFAAYSELGYGGLGAITIGISAKFGGK